MDPIEREKAGYKSRQTVSVKPPPNPAATVIVKNVSLLIMIMQYPSMLVFKVDLTIVVGRVAGFLCLLAEAEGCAQGGRKDSQC